MFGGLFFGIYCRDFGLRSLRSLTRAATNCRERARSRLLQTTDLRII